MQCCIGQLSMDGLMALDEQAFLAMSIDIDQAWMELECHSWQLHHHYLDLSFAFDSHRMLVGDTRRLDRSSQMK